MAVMKYLAVLLPVLTSFWGCAQKAPYPDPLSTYFESIDFNAKHQCQLEVKEDADIIAYKECLRRCKLNSYKAMQKRIKEELHILNKNTLREYFYYKNELQE